MLKIIDFIKSWFYYPTLIKWLNDNGYNNFPYSRFEYSLNHCRMKKWLKKQKKQGYAGTWSCCFQKEPILKNNETDARKYTG